MTPFTLGAPEQRFLDWLIDTAAGTRSFGADNEHLFEHLLDQLPPKDNDDEAQSGWLAARRLIILTAISSGCLARPVADRVMTWAWSTENEPQRLVPAETWLAAFDELDFTSDPDEPICRPEKPARLWRGATCEHRRGLAWTSDRMVAKTFAERHSAGGRTGEVFTARVEPPRVKARYNKEGEQEWVIDPRGLEIIRDSNVT